MFVFMFSCGVWTNLESVRERFLLNLFHNCYSLIFPGALMYLFQKQYHTSFYSPDLFISFYLHCTNQNLYFNLIQVSWKAARPSHAISGPRYSRIRSKLKCGSNLRGIHVTSPRSWLDCLPHGKHSGMHLCFSSNSVLIFNRIFSGQ